MKTVNVCEVTQHDGTGGEMHVCYTDSELVAENIIRNAKELNLEFPRWTKKTFNLMESCEEFTSIKMEKLRQQALSKLTNAERRALGV